MLTFLSGGKTLFTNQPIHLTLLPPAQNFWSDFSIISKIQGGNIDRTEETHSNYPGIFKTKSHQTEKGKRDQKINWKLCDPGGNWGVTHNEKKL